MLLNPLILARALGCDTSTPDWDDVRAAAARDDTCAVALALPLDDIISAVRARARERYPNAPTHAPTVAVGLLADLCGAGYPWGSPPREDRPTAISSERATQRAPTWGPASPRSAPPTSTTSPTARHSMPRLTTCCSAF